MSLDGRRVRDYDQEIIGTHNRIHRLLSAQNIRAMLGQTENCIDIAACMDRGDIILANLPYIPDALRRIRPKERRSPTQATTRPPP